MPLEVQDHDLTRRRKVRGQLIEPREERGSFIWLYNRPTVIR